MTWKNRLLRNFRLYAVTDLKRGDAQFLKKAEDALKGGADVLQLRSKVLTDAELVDAGRELRALTRKLKKLFIVNDRADIARVLDADGVHLGQDDLPVSLARKILKPGAIIGKSTHSLEQALAAQKEEIDYMGVGPVFSTPTKPAYKPVGLELVKQVASRARIPFVAIGGIGADNIEEVLECGAARVAVVRALWESPDAFRAAQNLKTILERYEVPLLQV
ncbi:MAG: thiamine-phosphate diphosphorylase [Omnitrophica bacterium GWA2_50_21]|nr:MAG: thiamine-phosphate diphosphorylase [Omnitrophica bacterium GWA2_50_21]